MDKLKLIFTDRRMLICFMLGFASGLPLLLTGSTLQAWCKEAGMDLTDIGLLALVGTPYTIKFLWSPVLDWIVPAAFGRRRGWLVITQIGLMLALAGMAVSNPHTTPTMLAVFALGVAFLSATQDIAIDAYQIELLPTELYGLGNQLYILGYRIGMLLASSGSLILADHMSWTFVYFIMAATMLVALVTTALSPEPPLHGSHPATFAEAVWEPLKDFFSPSGSLHGRALWVIGFFLLYKIGGDMASAMTMPLYLDLGYSKTEIGAVAKAFGLGATIVGGLIGGGAVVFLGLRKSLWIFGVVQGLGNLSFAWLAATVGVHAANPSLTALATAISVENLAAGLGTAAYTTFMGSLVNKRFTATQYALLSSLMGIPRVFGAAPTGWMAKNMGWETYFAFCALISIPGLLVLLKIQPGDATTPEAVGKNPSQNKTARSEFGGSESFPPHSESQAPRSQHPQR